MSSVKSVTLNCEMDNSNEEFDPQVLREAGENSFTGEWSGTLSAFNSSGTNSSNSYTNIQTLKEYCGNPSDTLNDKEDFMVLESTSNAINISNYNANDTTYHTERKTTAFQKKYKPQSEHFSRVFENILLDDDSQMEITQNSVCLNRFQKRKRLLPPNDEDFIEINNSNNSGLDSVEVSMMKTPKFGFSKKKKDQFNIPAYNLSISDSVSNSDVSNISQIKGNTSNLSFVVNDKSNNIIDESKTEVLSHKFGRKTIDVSDSVFDNIVNDSNITSNITLNNKKTSLSETSLSNVNSTSAFSKIDKSNLNHTYDIPYNTKSSTVDVSIAADANVSEAKQNTVFKTPFNSSLTVNDSSNNIMDVSKTEVFINKFSQKTIDVTNSVFDNIIDDSSLTSDITLNNKKTSLGKTSVSNVNNTPVFSKTDKSNLNNTYDIPINNNTFTVDVSIAGDANIPEVKQHTVFGKQFNSSLAINNSSNIMDISKTEVFINKFGRKIIDVTDSAFDNIINNSSMTTDTMLNNKTTSLNHTYDIPINSNTSTVGVSIAGVTNIPEVKQHTVFGKQFNSSLAVNNSSNIMDVSKTEVFINKFGRKIIDVTDSAFDNIINNSSMTSDIELNNKTSLNGTSVSNVHNTPGFSTMDISNLNHTYGIPTNNNSTLLDNIIENDKSISETPVLLEFNTSKSFNQLSFKFNFNKKVGRHSLSYQETRSKNDEVKKLNFSLNTDFNKKDGEEFNIFQKSANKSNENFESQPMIQEIPQLNNSLLTNTLNQKQLETKHSIGSNLNNEAVLLSNTTTRLLESDKLKKKRSEHSMCSTSSNEGLILLTSTTGFPERLSSSRNQSRHTESYASGDESFTSATMESVERNKSQINRSMSPALNNEVGNATMKSLEINDSQKNQSRRSTSLTSYNEGLTLLNSTTGFFGSRSSSRNESTSNHSASCISNDDSLPLSNSTTGISASGSSSRNQSRLSESSTSDDDNLTNDTSRSLEMNDSQKSQTNRSMSSTLSNEGLTLLNSTTGFFESRSSSRNKSTSLTSKHSTRSNLNDDSLPILNSTAGVLVSGISSRNRSRQSKSVDSDNDSKLSNSITESEERNESLKSLSKRSMGSTLNNETLTNSTTELSGRRSSSRNKSTLASEYSTSSISNNDSLPLSNSNPEVSVSSSSSKHTLSSSSDDDSFTNASMTSFKSNNSQTSQSKRSISPISYNEGLTKSTAGFIVRRSSSRNKSISLASKHSKSSISNNDIVPLLNSITEVSVSGTSTRNKSRHTNSSASDEESVSNASMKSVKKNKSQKSLSNRSISHTLNNKVLSDSATAFSERRSSSRNKSISLTSKHSTSSLSNNDIVPLLNSITEVSVSGRSSKRTKMSASNGKRNKSQINRSMSPTLNNEVLSDSTTAFSERRSLSRNKSIPLAYKHSSSSTLNNDIFPLLNSITEVSVSGRSSNHTKMSASDNESTTNASMESVERNKSQINRSMSPTLNNEVLSDSTTAFSEIRSLSRNKSIPLAYKHSTSFTSNNDIFPSLNSITEVSGSGRSSRHTNNSGSDDNNFTNATMESLDQHVSSINQPNESISKYSSSINTKKTSTNSSLKNDTSSINKTPTSSVLRSSSGLLNKNKSIRSTRTSKNADSCKNSGDNTSDDSLFWTTLSDESTSKSSSQSINVNTFQTPKNNKLTIAENIVNTIKMMSRNKQKSNHPGAFQLEDLNDGPLTRSFLTPSNNRRSPSILTMVFGEQNASESTSMLSQSVSEIIIDESQVEENVKQKFKSLYNKESWITKRLYKFITVKLQPNYNIYSVKYAEKIIKYLALIFKTIYSGKVNLQLYSDMLRYHLARYGIIKDTFDYIGFLCDYIPMVYYKKLVPEWNLEISEVKFDPQKSYIPLMEDEEFLNYIMEHLNEA